MNLFEATLVGRVDEMYIDAGTFRVLVPSERAERLKE